MSLEANSMDWASIFLEFFNQFEHPVRLDLLPSRSRCMVVIVVEEFNLRVCFMSSFECFANEIGNDRPWTFLNWILSRPFVVNDRFINDVPCKDVIAELFNNMFDIGGHVPFKRSLILLIDDETGVMSTWRCPDKGVSSEFHIILFGKVDKILASGEIVMVKGFGNSVHLALVFGSDEVVLFGSLFSVGFIGKKIPVVEGCAH